jgi:dGTPase
VSINRPSEGGVIGAISPFASDPAASRGRVYAESPSPWRSDFQRDRDRIIHATSFRRLKGKTQVFLAGEGDHYRTRLTHTLEVAQIARSLARALGLNEDLTEAVALAHDLGHPPFGHSGERALAHAAAAFGGFDHNIQSLRVVTRLEHRYPRFDGLNLTWEVLEGLAKHNGPITDAAGAPLRGNAIPPTIAAIDDWQDLMLATFAGGEAQCAAIADDIAYDAHDIDDGLRSGLLALDGLAEVPVLGRHIADIERDYPGLDRERLVPELVRRLINWLVEDVLAETRRRLAGCSPSADGIRLAGRVTVAFSADVAEAERSIKRYLNAELYQSPVVTDVMRQAETLVAALFEHYWRVPEALPEAWRRDLDDDDQRRGRRIADFLAGMTDRFALAEYRRLFDRVPEFG